MSFLSHPVTLSPHTCTVWRSMDPPIGSQYSAPWVFPCCETWASSPPTLPNYRSPYPHVLYDTCNKSWGSRPPRRLRTAPILQANLVSFIRQNGANKTGMQRPSRYYPELSHTTSVGLCKLSFSPLDYCAKYLNEYLSKNSC